MTTKEEKEEPNKILEILEEYFTKAATLVRDGNHIDAIAAYIKIASNDNATLSQKVRAYSNLSACYAAKDQYNSALEVAKKALEIDENNSKIHGRLATAYHGLKHYEEAANHYKRAHELDPSNKLYEEQYRTVLELIQGGRGLATQETRDVYYYKKGIEQGKEAMIKGEYLTAVRHFTKAIELHSRCTTNSDNNNDKLKDLAVLLCNRSAAYSRLSRYVESLEDAMKATEVNPMYARAFFRIGYAQHHLKHANESFAALKRCLEIDASHAEAKNLIIEVEQVVADLRKTAEEKQREKEEKVKEIREMQNSERASDNITATSSFRGRAHATTYLHCGYCNESGHVRAECPLLRRKRSRMP